MYSLTSDVWIPRDRDRYLCPAEVFLLAWNPGYAVMDLEQFCILELEIIGKDFRMIKNKLG